MTRLFISEETVRLFIKKTRENKISWTMSYAPTDSNDGWCAYARLDYDNFNIVVGASSSHAFLSIRNIKSGETSNARSHTDYEDDPDLIPIVGDLSQAVLHQLRVNNPTPDLHKILNDL